MQTDILKSVCGTCIFFTRCLRCFTTKVKHVNKEIEAFMKINHPDVLGNVPLKYLRRTKDPVYFFMIDDNVASIYLLLTLKYNKIFYFCVYKFY